MSDDAERIRRQMQNIRQEMGAEVKDIVHGARQLTDWRYYVRHYPWACAAGAMSLGFLLMPGKKRGAAAAVNVDRLVAEIKNQLANQGLATPTNVGSFAPSGIAGRLLATAGPFLARRAVEMIAQRLAAAPHDAETPPRVSDPA
jgi:hypothetical protein